MVFLFYNIGDNIDTLSLFAGDTVLAFFNNGDLNGVLAFVVLYIFRLILCLDVVFPPVLCRQGVLLFNGLECLKDFFAALYNFKWLYLFLYDNESPFFFLPLKTPI